MNLRRAMTIAAFALLVAGPARAQPDRQFYRLVGPTNTQFLDFGPNGMAVWSNAATGTYGIVQHAASVQAESNWIELLQCPATGTVFSLRLLDPDPPAGMVFIPAGRFQMGDSFDEGSSDERPVHDVVIGAFYVDQYEVTLALWESVRQWAATNGYEFEAAGSGPGSN